MKTDPSRSNSLNMRLFILPILYRKQEKIVVCDSFQGIKNRQPHIRLPAIAIIVNAINQNLIMESKMIY